MPAEFVKNILFIFCFTTTKKIAFFKIIHENTSLFQACNFFLCGNRGRQVDICYTNL